MFIISSFPFTSTSTLLFMNSVSPLFPSSSPSIKIDTSLMPLNASFALPELGSKRRRKRRKWRAVDGSGEKQSVSTVASSPATKSFDDDDDNISDSASAVVRNFYGGINAHDVDSVQYLIAENCVYEDLVFPRPFVGRKEILQFFRKFTSSTSKDLQFVIDDLSTEDSSSVGVIWHLEWKGKPFPFSKGCSFYRVEVINGKRQITYGRDCVEPAIKPGDATLCSHRETAIKHRP
ncbi:unnamed protein product [Sphenostylis stenocarpa]|uniref:Nuclear transport factor 2 domain-containing protein n=1 Tax=Sphenostylis stenocarpa TaxID=92480 RepID=A0AA86RSL5_9FABA|nr:unnamed protein product [Sphenostylis stenocarpa]